MENRTKLAFLNVFVTFGTFFGTMLMTFIVRTVFIRTMGDVYLGLNGVVTSILSTLSIMDLGMESVFAFAFYKPLVDKNYLKLQAYLNLFKKMYRGIGISVFVLGMALFPFLNNILGVDAGMLNEAKAFYLIMLTATSSSYFFTYNRTILNADQKNYIVVLITFIINFLGNVIQIIVLLSVKNLLIYAIIQLGMNVIANILITLVTNKKYGKYFESALDENAKLTKFEVKQLFKNVVGGFSNKIGSVVVFGTDNMIISAFVGLISVGKYSNYMMIINSVSSILTKSISAVTGSIGQKAAERPSQMVVLFNRLVFGVHFVLFITVPVMFIFFDSFISVWVGKRFVLPMDVLIVIILNFTLQISRIPALIFIDATGLQWIQRWKSIVEAILNLVASLTFVVIFKLGILGVSLGTLFSTILSVYWYEPWILYKKVFAKNVVGYFFREVVMKGQIIASTLVIFKIIHSNRQLGLEQLLLHGALGVLMELLLFVSLNFRRSEFSYYKMLICKKIGRI